MYIKETFELDAKHQATSEWLDSHYPHLTTLSNSGAYSIVLKDSQYAYKITYDKNQIAFLEYVSHFKNPYLPEIISVTNKGLLSLKIHGDDYIEDLEIFEIKMPLYQKINKSKESSYLLAKYLFNHYNQKNKDELIDLLKCEVYLDKELKAVLCKIYDFFCEHFDKNKIPLCLDLGSGNLMRKDDQLILLDIMAITI